MLALERDTAAPRIITQRLAVSPCKPQDIAALQELFAQPELLAGLFARPAAEAAFLAARTQWLSTAYCLNMVARLRSTQTVVGAIRLVQNQLSYCIDPAWGRVGLGGELVAGVTQWAWTDRTELVAIVQRDNIASRRVLERAGFQFSGLDPGHAQSAAGGAALLYRAARPAGSGD
jgi:RimJ/RimL family protein N-acetyltransferase